MKLQFLALALAVASANAAEYTYSWVASEQPASILDGLVTFTYVDDGSGNQRILTMNVNAAAGDTIIFTGDTMSFVQTETYKTATITQKNAGKVIFKNEVSARSFAVMNSVRDNRCLTWWGGETFIDTNWTNLFKNATLDDMVPVTTCQKPTDSAGKKPTNFTGRGAILEPYHIKRSTGHLSCIYQYTWTQGSAVTDVICVWAEFRQNGNDIQMRLTDAGRMIPLPKKTRPDIMGMDPDSLCGQYEWYTDTHKIRTTGNANGGCGMNTVQLMGINVVYRFENTVTMTGSPNPDSGVRFEFADASKFNSYTYAYAGSNSEIAFRDGSKTLDLYSNFGAGTLRFETTKATSSPSVTNCIEIANAINSSINFRILGIDGYPMILRVKNKSAYPTGGEVIVEQNGILEMKAGSDVVEKGIKDGAVSKITVNKGGIVRQCATNVFGTNTFLTVNGGTIEFDVGDPGEWDVGTALFNLTLRDGAMLVGRGSSSRFLRIGRSRYANQASWLIGGVSPSTNAVPIQFMSVGDGVGITNTFNVAKTGDYDADFVTVSQFSHYDGSLPYWTNVLRKVGLGTFRFDAAYTIPGSVELEQGFIRLGKSDLWGKKDRSIVTPVNLRGGSLSFVAGTSNSMGEIRLYENASLVVEQGATVAFPDLRNVAWTSGKTLDITMPRNSGGFGATVRFGTSASALTAQQLSQIRVNGKRAHIGSSGELIVPGLLLIVR